MPSQSHYFLYVNFIMSKQFSKKINNNQNTIHIMKYAYKVSSPAQNVVHFALLYNKQHLVDKFCFGKMDCNSVTFITYGNMSHNL